MGRSCRTTRTCAPGRSRCWCDAAAVAPAVAQPADRVLHRRAGARWPAASGRGSCRWRRAECAVSRRARRPRRHLPAPGRHAARDRAGLRHRHAARAGVRPVAGAGAAGQRHPRSLHQGRQLDAARDPGADLRACGSAWASGARWRWPSRWCSSSCSSTSTRASRRSARWCWPTRACWAPTAQLLRTVYLPSATSWVFSSLHTSVGLAFVGAVVGEYLGSARGVGYLILQAEGTFDVNTVFAGIVVLTGFALVLDGWWAHRAPADEVAAAIRARPRSWCSRCASWASRRAARCAC
jgi:hypothetical protein